jgi:FkbM family methyltransferase
MVRRLKNDKPVIFDVGANIGQSVIRFKKILPQSQIYSFEPSARPFDQLSIEASLHSDVKAFQFALGSSNGKLTLYENSCSDMNSFLEMGSGGSGSVLGQSTVPVKTVDEFCAEYQINYIDILKIDAQGFDFEVIKGSKQMILSGKIRQIYFEIIFSDMYKNVPRFSEVYDFLLDHGFVLVSLYDFHYQKGVAGWTDGLFIYRPALQNSNSSEE